MPSQVRWSLRSERGESAVGAVRAVPALLSPPLKRVPPSGSAVTKIWTKSLLPGSKRTHVVTAAFCPQPGCAGATGFCLKTQCCPRCGKSQTLNWHSVLHGNDPSSQHQDGEWTRGQRVFCSNRGRRGGCGHTFAIYVADVFPRHTVSATLLWKLLLGWLAGSSLKAAAQALPFALETLYHLRQRLRRRLDELRRHLCQRQPAPTNSQSDPLAHTVEHLQSAFPESVCPLSEFQLAFQCPFLG